ncbi:MAG: Gfo/Idh/MocA family oxidoreductase [Armatimonadetes bacterium]|nr:Gfo/Idh/MocA family oxidoreductase [Armatimonadota bacterium]MDE2206038.1 Gfo/Idh/MocA family oxidoreductase [Armatimonadota bacterium]
MANRKWRFIAVDFDHLHIGDLLRLVSEHPGAEIAGMYDADPQRMAEAAERFGVPPDRLFTNLEICLASAAADVALLCSRPSRHAEYVEQMASCGISIHVEKPFATSLEEADRMIRAMQAGGGALVVNWPLAWYPPHVTAKRLVDSGAIGALEQVHYYDGNRGPLRHLADKVEVAEADAAARMSDSWWYTPGDGGSMRDYLGYGATLATWFFNGELPSEVTSVALTPGGRSVDEQSVTVARYRSGLSVFQTRWGTFTDPWVLQPQPKCGFTLVGSAGTISSWDYEPVIHLQTKEQPRATEIPVDTLLPPFRNSIEYLVAHLESGAPVTGPLSVEISRAGQQITDAAQRSSVSRRPESLAP